jgi:hypothetical protein
MSKAAIARVSFPPQAFAATFAPHLCHPFTMNPRFAHFMTQQEVNDRRHYPPNEATK